MARLPLSDLIEAHRHGDRGRLVAVLHGGPGAPGSVCSLARSLASRYTVLEPLQRRSGSRPLTVSRHVDDHAALLPARVAIVGWSWGAMLGLSYAAAYPERVTRLGLVGCGSYDEASRVCYRQRLAGRLGDDTVRFDTLARQLAEASTSVGHEPLLAELGELAERAQSVDPLPQLEPRLPLDAAGHAETWADVLRRQASGQEPSAFAAITCPVVMFHGRDDPHPGPAIRDSLRRHIPQLDYFEFRDCGHRPWRERQARPEFMRTLTAWLDAETC